MEFFKITLDVIPYVVLLYSRNGVVRLLIVHSKTPFEKQDKVSVAGGYLVLRYGCYL